MEGIIIQAAQLIMSLSILVILHEFGHFLPARIFGIRVEKFYLFFDPKFSLFKIKKGDTEYGIGWLPLGGYVKLSGMMDESMDKEQLKEEPKPWEFRSKPAWQRLIVMVGGVVVNVILGMMIYSMILFVWGKEYIPAKSAKYGMYYTEVAKEVGFKDGDKVIALNNEPIADNITYGDILNQLLLNSDLKTVTVDNEGEERVVHIPNDFPKRVLASEKKGLFTFRVPFYVDSIVDGSPTIVAGLKKNDRVIGINNVDVPYFQDFSREVEKFKGEKIDLKVERNGQELVLPVELTEEGKLMVFNRHPSKYFDVVTKEYSFVESIPAGINEAVGKINWYIDQFSLVFTKEGAKSIGGFGAIGSMFEKKWVWHVFWERTAFISLILAFMNILPIPALDGGHVMFLLYEIVSGRKPGEKFLEYAQIAGFVLLLSLMLFANGNDLFRAFTK